jgi:hypothetical protein
MPFQGFHHQPAARRQKPGRDFGGRTGFSGSKGEKPSVADKAVQFGHGTFVMKHQGMENSLIIDHVPE